jgi:hypothetical protein
MEGCGIIREARQKPGHPFNLIVNRGSVAAFKIVARCAKARWRGGRQGKSRGPAAREARRERWAREAGLLLNVPPHG